MIFGRFINTGAVNGVTKPQNQYICNSQLLIFRYSHPKTIISGGGVWLRDVVNSECFSKMFGLGYPYSSPSNEVNSVCPFFCIC